jgi:hypothetical protein
MAGSVQSLIQPRYIALDTSTYVNLLRQQTDRVVKDIFQFLNTGLIIPYVCFEHILELLQYNNQKIRAMRLDFFREFRLIGSPKLYPSPPWRNSPLCGSYQDDQLLDLVLTPE